MYNCNLNIPENKINNKNDSIDLLYEMRDLLSPFDEFILPCGIASYEDTPKVK
jgi:hypothetical protein